MGCDAWELDLLGVKMSSSKAIFLLFVQFFCPMEIAQLQTLSKSVQIFVWLGDAYLFPSPHHKIKDVGEGFLPLSAMGGPEYTNIPPIITDYHSFIKGRGTCDWAILINVH